MKHIRLFALVICSFVLSFTKAQETAQEWLQKGNSLYAEGKYSAAVGCYKKAADMNNAEAQFCMGYAYYAGEGIIKNYESAARWFHLSAAQKYPKAQYNLAFCYMEGKGVDRDYDEARRLLFASAEGGFPQAQVTLAECYANGVLVEKDSLESEKWKERARESNQIMAEENTKNDVKPRVVIGPSKMNKTEQESTKPEEKKERAKSRKKPQKVDPKNQIEIQLD
jgi:TPR repeat protein